MPRTKDLPREVHPDILYRASELTRFGLSAPTRWRLKREHGIRIKGIRSGSSVFYEGSEIIRVIKERDALSRKK